MRLTSKYISNILISQGDISGIGPEIIAKALNNLDVKKHNIEKVGIVATKTGENFIKKYLKSSKKIEFIKPDLSMIPQEYQSSEELQSLYYAVHLCKTNMFNALVTAPIDKAKTASRFSGFTGHTGFLKSITNTQNVLMTMMMGSMNIGILTEHIPLKDVPASISTEKIINACRLLNNNLNNTKKNIVVLALNPHAGDNGVAGEEENTIIIPAIEQLKKEKIDVIGPLPADSAFEKKYIKQACAFLAMYHDQGMIPAKMSGLHRVTNVTFGLPFVRTSPGHGVAYDIAGKNIADYRSMLKAIIVAQKLSIIRTKS